MTEWGAITGFEVFHSRRAADEADKAPMIMQAALHHRDSQGFNSSVPDLEGDWFKTYVQELGAHEVLVSYGWHGTS